MVCLDKGCTKRQFCRPSTSGLLVTSLTRPLALCDQNHIKSGGEALDFIWSKFLLIEVLHTDLFGVEGRRNTEATT